MRENLKSRVLKYIEYLGISIQAFESSVGLSNAAVSKMGDNTRRATVDKISNKYPDLNVSWLLTGEGDMLKDAADNLPINTDINATGDLNGKDYRLVPLINIDSVGGIHSDNSIDSSEQYVIKMLPFTEARSGDVAILQSGNSMYPTIPSGSALLIRQVVDWQEYFGYGNLYVLWLKDGRRITKVVQCYDDAPDKYVLCVSYNPDVAPERLPRRFIQGVWKVVKYIADFGW